MHVAFTNAECGRKLCPTRIPPEREENSLAVAGRFSVIFSRNFLSSVPVATIQLQPSGQRSPRSPGSRPLSSTAASPTPSFAAGSLYSVLPTSPSNPPPPPLRLPVLPPARLKKGGLHCTPNWEPPLRRIRSAAAEIEASLAMHHRLLQEHDLVGNLHLLCLSD
jgi:hypothetical protein